MSDKFKSLSMLFLYFIAFVPSSIQSQTNHDSSKAGAEKNLLLSFNVGINTFALGEVEDFYDAILQQYEDNNIPVSAQRKFPPNLVLGAELLFRLPSQLHLGAGMYYTWTRALFLYEDYAGELDVNSKVTMLGLQGIVQKDFTATGAVTPYLDVRGGVVAGWLEFLNEIRVDEIAALNSKSTLSAKDFGYCVEAAFGVKRFGQGYFLSARAGFRYAKIDRLNGELKANNAPTVSGSLPFAVDLSGFVLIIGFGKEL